MIKENSIAFFDASALRVPVGWIWQFLFFFFLFLIFDGRLVLVAKLPKKKKLEFDIRYNNVISTVSEFVSICLLEWSISILANFEYSFENHFEIIIKIYIYILLLL